jgi:carboxyl-terminal processing protease
MKACFLPLHFLLNIMNNIPDKSPRIKLYLPLLLAVVLAAGLFAGMQFGKSGTSSPDQKFFSIGLDRYDKINDILNYIHDSYVDTVSREELTEQAVLSMLKNLDPHSAYIPASHFREMNDPLMGSFEGIGIEFNMINDTVVVITPISGGPSEKAGIMSGDRIIKVEEEHIAGVSMSTNDIVSRLKGKKGTQVTVSVFRRNVPDIMVFTLTRDIIPSYSLDIAYMVDPDIGYVRLNKFSATTHPEFVSAVERLKREGMSKMILDLRGNGGGFLDAAINLADELLEPGKLIVYTDGRRRPKTFAHARRNGIFETDPLIILIDEWSASASEIIAGAVQDNDRAMLIGRRSFGKGLVQEQVQLRDGSALRLTVSRYYTPSGRSIQKPYDNGNEEYYQEFLQRFLDGEMQFRDSIHFNDSLRYETADGRIVYGGGGIMPDVFVPADTGRDAAFFNQVANRGLIYRYAFQFADDLRKALSAIDDADKYIEHFKLAPLIYQNFLAFAADNGMNINQGISAESEKMIKVYLRAYIGRSVFGNDAFYPIVLAEDPAFNKALEVLRSDECPFQKYRQTEQSLTAQ